MNDDGSNGGTNAATPSKSSDSDVVNPSNGSDIANPLFLHSSDHVGLILVSKKLNGNNYNTWSCAIRIALSAKNKLGLVDGSLEPDLAGSVIYLPNAHEIWVNLHEHFSQGNGPYLFQIQREINSLTQAKNETNKLIQFFMGLNESYSAT
ncbi:uncharacterized protein LOC119985545 [Tripterygium wilfordii]|uniref:uncharacterized protein LOC119985545 n=1 Tax=Tripterygium wilfordii TaxID=458696 RepID=UPI0018F80007|nr:uncharacterized protein LOC119985545 [Tripterygium wilfordii]